jgi:hypothetical protein
MKDIQQMSDNFDWSVPPLDSADQRLVEVYQAIGRPVDDLPYTEEFENLFAQLSEPNTPIARHLVYKRLLNLRKRGQLPRVNRFAAH